MNDIDLNLALSICALQRSLSRALNHGEGSDKFGWTEYCLLKSACENPGFNVQQLAVRVSLSSGSATYTLDKLEGKGLLVRKPSPSDGRSCEVYLTKSGEILQKQLSRRLKEVSSNLFQGIINEKKCTCLEVVQEAIKRAESIE